MFSGSWKESNMMEINLEIPDQNIDTEGERTSVAASRSRLCLFVFYWQNFTVFCVWVALQVVFGSLYRDDVLIKPSRVVSILAAACMLQLVSTLKEVSHCLKYKIWPWWILLMQSYDTSLIKPHGLLLLTGWLDPAVRRDYEGKHQR